LITEADAMLVRERAPTLLLDRRRGLRVVVEDLLLEGEVPEEALGDVDAGDREPVRDDTHGRVSCLQFVRTRCRTGRTGLCGFHG
jgi:hypothetical protein